MIIIGVSGRSESGAEAAALHLAEKFHMYFLDLYAAACYSPHYSINVLNEHLEIYKQHNDLFDGMTLYPVSEIGEADWIREHGGTVLCVTKTFNCIPIGLTDQLVRNDATLETLHKKLFDIVENLQQEARK